MKNEIIGQAIVSEQRRDDRIATDGMLDERWEVQLSQKQPRYAELVQSNERVRNDKIKNEIVVQAIVGMHANNFNNNNKIEIELFQLFSGKYTRNDDDRFRVGSATKPVYEENQN